MPPRICIRMYRAATHRSNDYLHSPSDAGNPPLARCHNSMNCSRYLFPWARRYRGLPEYSPFHRYSRTMCSYPLINFRIKVNRWSHLSRTINPRETRVIIYDDVNVTVSPSRKKIRAVYLRTASTCHRMLRNKHWQHHKSRCSGEYAWFCSI